MKESSNNFDVIIIGAGVIGASCARNLAKYNLNVLVLEKNADVGDETSCANSAIVHSGYDPKPNSLKAKFNVLGNSLFDDVCRDLDVEFQRIGSLTVATTDEELEQLDKLYKNGISNGVDVEIISKETLFEMEPFVTKKSLGALWAKTSGIVNPFELVVALMENAIDNGVTLHLNEEVTFIENVDGLFKITTNVDSYNAKVCINAAGLNSDFINNFINEKEETIPRIGEYYVLDHFTNEFNQYVSHTLFSLPSEKGKGVLVSPTTHGNFLIGPSSEFISDKEYKGTTSEGLKDVLEEAKRLVDYIPMQHLIREFSGVRAFHKSNDFCINMKVPGFINLLGIQSPGLASSPAIANEVVNIVSSVIELVEKDNYNPKRRPLYRVNKLSIEKRNELILKDPNFGRVICRCEQITLGEILDSINRNCGATTIKGIKKRVRPGFGKCQGTFCEPYITKILSKELNKSPKDVNYSNKGSYIIDSFTKENNHEN